MVLDAAEKQIEILAADVERLADIRERLIQILRTESRVDRRLRYDGQCAMRV
jgi:hypothetical protein